MKIEGCTALVTGAHGGIGSAFVSELIERGAAKVYVATHVSGARRATEDARIVEITLDVTDASSINQAALIAPDVSLLINNAGYMGFTGALAAKDLTHARREMDVNYFGPLAVTRAFRAALASNGGGVVLNMLSMASLVSLPVTGTYSASKSAFLSITRSIRAEMTAQGTSVIGVLAVQTDSAMGERLPPPRQTPIEVVKDALDAVEAGLSEEIAAGALTRGAYQKFLENPKALQEKMSGLLPKAE